VAQCLERACADPLTKESLDEATSNSKITIRVNDKIPSYWQFKFENGDIILEHKKSICNTGEITWADLARFIPTQAGALPLPVRKNIEANREKQQELLEEIAQSTGSGEWILEIDWNANVSKVDQHSRERLGDVYIQEVLVNFSELLKDKLKNETLKEAFNEATSARTVSILVGTDKLPAYWVMAIKDNSLVITHKPNICNTGEVRYYDIATIIPVPGIIDLVGKLNLEERRNEHFEGIMEKIKAATGEDFTFDEGSIEQFYSKAEKHEKNRIGDIIYGEVLPNLARNLEDKLKDEMVKEAFLETVSARQIQLVADPKAKTYWDIKFTNGVLVLTGKTPICNTGEITYFDIEKLL